MLPQALLLLLQTWIVVADTQQLPLNQLQTFSSATANPATYALPVSPHLSVSVALCSYKLSNSPRFFVSNKSSFVPGPDDLGKPNVYEIDLGDGGLGSWTGAMNVSGTLAVYNATQVPFEVGVSDDGPIHQTLDSLPEVGDTTASQVLLFSPPFSPPDFPVPTYPNYTLPPANLSLPPEPASPPDYSIFIAPTSSSALASLPRTGCAMRASSGNVGVYEPASASEGLWLRDAGGWRWQWFVNGMAPQTNYTAYAVKNGTQVTAPINFVTKSATFSCPIVYGLPYCPSVAYAAPIPGADPATGVTAQTLPSELSSYLISNIANLTVMLTTLACGRDLYSPLVTCADCLSAYRTWLCFVSLPRCAEYPSSSSSSSLPAPALQEQNATNPRNTALPPYPENYTAVLPCVEVCNAADRACPPFLGFRCPLPQYTAGSSYGVGFIDSGVDGQVGGGSTGTAADQWGNVWCNYGGVL
ncbi:hypothetical protein WOLCODRAFT_19550 [Wolfiporia cocos MD-104 SS10]|uniref:FZ domain-containing protein n=1 Tax=Wolfiporia cocos (strain MD-104) TaxID=742152 RepID=A0A2H3J7P0_WOLCO|nr:hypothetical protein WOLCODRAFT_19550 [Wolfiporia cocos MD-104 SS10]